METSIAESPKVFISHSSEDKGRFVIRLAERLRENGVNAWLDRWEMLPGDSLVDKIWNGGLKDCKAIIVVLSLNSINSKWVREELNTGVVKRIEGDTKLIPVRLDGCEVPECLKSTLWVDIPDPDNYGVEFQRILSAVYGQYDKPPIGTTPIHAQGGGPTYFGLAKIDSRVFQVACMMAIEQDEDLVVSEQLIQSLKDSGVSGEQMSECLEVLSHQHCIEPIRAGQLIPAFRITASGFEQFLRHEIQTFDSLHQRVRVLLARNSADNTADIAKEIEQPDRVAAFFLDDLERKGLIKMAHLGTGSMRKVYHVSPVLRRSGQA